MIKQYVIHPMTVAVNFVGGGGIEGVKCISKRGKNPKIYQKWLRFAI